MTASGDNVWWWQGEADGVADDQSNKYEQKYAVIDKKVKNKVSNHFEALALLRDHFYSFATGTDANGSSNGTGSVVIVVNAKTEGSGEQEAMEVNKTFEGTGATRAKAAVTEHAEKEASKISRDVLIRLFQPLRINMSHNGTQRISIPCSSKGHSHTASFGMFS